jgi:hypothetical protein
MAVLYDARGNEVAAPLDLLNGNNFTDARPTTVLLAALNADTVVELNGQTTAMIDCRSAAFAGTLTVQGTVDGNNWTAIPAVNIVTQAAVVDLVLTGASTTVLSAHVGGFQAVRVRVTAYTSGNIDVGIRATVAALRPSLERPYPTTLWVTATAAANTAATATLPAPAAGLFHYITHIDITRNATAALAGGATIIHTTTNLPGSPAWSVGNNMVAGGTERDVWIDFAQPLKSSTAAAATTVVCAAAGAAVLGRVNVGYFVGA